MLTSATPFLLALTLCQAAATTTHWITWTPGGLTNYTLGTPLTVNIRDNVIIGCPDGQIDIFIATELVQYMTCTCEIEGFQCEDKPIIDPCLTANNNIAILDQPGILGAVYQFEAGTTYYLIGVPVNRRSGNCNETGLRISMRVAMSVSETTSTSYEETVKSTEMAQTSSISSDAVDMSTTEKDLEPEETSKLNIIQTLGKEEEDGLKSTSRKSTSRIDVIVGPVIAVLVVLALLCGAIISIALFVVYKYHMNKNESDNDNTFCYTEGQLADMFDQDGTRVAMRTNAMKETNYIEMQKENNPPEEVKIDLSFSQSLQNYEPMNEIIRTSQSSLLKPMEEEEDTDHPKAMGDSHSVEEEHKLQCNTDITDQPEEHETTSNVRPVFNLPVASTTSTTQQSDENPDLINLQTPTHSHCFNPQSSISSFTVLAEMRAKKYPALPKQSSISEDIEVAQDFVPVSQDRSKDSPTNEVKYQDKLVSQAQSFGLKRSKSEELLDKMGEASDQPCVPSRRKFMNLSMDNLADIDKEKRPIPKPRTLPRQKMAKKKEEVPSQSSDHSSKLTQNGALTGSKRHSSFEKSGEVFNFTESL